MTLGMIRDVLLRSFEDGRRRVVSCRVVSSTMLRGLATHMRQRLRLCAMVHRDARPRGIPQCQRPSGEAERSHHGHCSCEAPTQRTTDLTGPDHPTTLTTNMLAVSGKGPSVDAHTAAQSQRTTEQDMDGPRSSRLRETGGW